jgi:hypothetical protein
LHVGGGFFKIKKEKKSSDLGFAELEELAAVGWKAMKTIREGRCFQDR